MTRWMIALYAALSVLVVVLDVAADRGWMIVVADGIFAALFIGWLAVEMIEAQSDGIGGA